MSAVELHGCSLLQVAPWRGQSAAFAARLHAAGWQLPPLGAAWFAAGRLAVAVRPGRWLLLIEPGADRAGARSDDPPAAAGPASAAPVDLLAGTVGDTGAVIDLSAARCTWRCTGPAAREQLAAGCRLDLHPDAFPVGRAAATVIAQVSVILVAYADDWLLLAPRSTAVHFSEWLQRIG